MDKLIYSDLCSYCRSYSPIDSDGSCEFEEVCQSYIRRKYDLDKDDYMASQVHD